MEWKEIFNQALANIISAIIIFILGLLVLDDKRVLRPWLYRIFGKRFSSYVNYLLLAIFHPLLRVMLVIVLLAFINIKKGDYILSVLVGLILLTFLIRPRREKGFLPVAEYQDRFDTLDNWETKTGSPSIEKDFGKPAPDLGLSYITGQATNSLIFHKKIEKERGIIECDFYLEDGAILNILFFADKERDKWYMARYDSRNNFSDGFLIKSQGPGVNWVDFKMSGTQTKIKEWHRARIEFSSTKVAMYKDGNLMVEFNNPQIFGKKIGFFNELNHIHVDNFSFNENVE